MTAIGRRLAGSLLVAAATLVVCEGAWSAATGGSLVRRLAGGAASAAPGATAERAAGRGAPSAELPAERSEAADVVAALVAAGNGLWDSHPDSTVARVLQPGLVDRDDVGLPVSSNAFGMREREYTLPKPPGTVRVVLLGDSFIYGMGVRADERLGVYLQRELAARSGVRPVPTIEVLHVGATSWNLQAECAFVRRQLTLLKPDLVVHFTVPNDLDDTMGVRGMGVLARHVPQRPEQANAVISMTFGRFTLDLQARGLLPWGLDDESRTRLQESADDVERLARSIEAAGGRYLFVINWLSYAGVAAANFGTRLAPERVCFLPISFYRDERYRLSATDEHWSPAGHEVVARFLYGAIVQRGLLPALSPAPWDEAEAQFLDLSESGHREAHRTDALDGPHASLAPTSAVDLAALTPTAAGQVHGGVSRDGLVAPYASVLLAREGGLSLRLVGQGLLRPELDGARVEVHVDSDKAGEFVLRAGAPIDERFPLPASALQRKWVTVRLRADDFVYAGADLRQCVVFRLQRLAIER